MTVTSLARLVLLGLPLALAACQTMDREDFRKGVKITRESPTLRKELVDDCIARFGRDGRSLPDGFVREIGVPRSEAVPTVCRRLIAGITSGRIRYEDLERLDQGYRTPRLLAVIRGR